MNQNRKILLPLAVSCAIGASPAFADEESFFSNWLENVSKTQEAQPHWMTPLVTVTPRLEQEFRYDMSRQYQANATTLNNFGVGKGLELIPSENTEVIVGVPAYEQKQTPTKRSTGWADENLLLKYRVLSANEEHGNYIVSTFVGISLPTGDAPFTAHHTIVTPTLAAGKGWGDRDTGLDVQSTLSAAIPTAGTDVIGVPVTWNTALQAHVGKIFWPEIEASYTHWNRGEKDGKSQLVMTYGLILGRFPIENRIKAILGMGYQVVQGTNFGTFDHAWLGTARLTF